MTIAEWRDSISKKREYRRQAAVQKMQPIIDTELNRLKKDKEETQIYDITVKKLTGYDITPPTRPEANKIGIEKLPEYYSPKIEEKQREILYGVKAKEGETIVEHTKRGELAKAEKETKAIEDTRVRGVINTGQQKFGENWDEAVLWGKKEEITDIDSIYAEAQKRFNAEKNRLAAIAARTTGTSKTPYIAQTIKAGLAPKAEEILGRKLTEKEAKKLMKVANVVGKQDGMDGSNRIKRALETVGGKTAEIVKEEYNSKKSEVKDRQNEIKDKQNELKTEEAKEGWGRGKYDKELVETIIVEVETLEKELETLEKELKTLGYDKEDRKMLDKIYKVLKPSGIDKVKKLINKGKKEVKTDTGHEGYY